MRFDPVTARWTEALFTLARGAGVLDEVGRDMQRLGEQVSGPGVKKLPPNSRSNTYRKDWPLSASQGLPPEIGLKLVLIRKPPSTMWFDRNFSPSWPTI